jgi:16S rRNA (uracil1498-N3)-methyltransferase
VSQLWAFLESFGSSQGALDVVALSADDSRHVAARRLRPGDSIVVFDGAGRMASAVIESIGRRAVEVCVGAVENVPAQSDRWVLATAIPKGERLATMLPMLVQLGVPTWQPLVLDDSAVRDLEIHSPRIRRILVESAKLARHPWLLELREPLGLGELLAAARPGAEIGFGDREGEEIGVPAETSLMVIGPEAGLSAEEIRRLRSAGARACSFGAHNMRIETAAAAAAAARFVAKGSRGSDRDG